MHECIDFITVGKRKQPAAFYPNIKLWPVIIIKNNTQVEQINIIKELINEDKSFQDDCLSDEVRRSMMHSKY